jgi:hypothetical protein
MDMKKTLAFLILSLVMISCYDDYVKDFDYSAVYFPYQVDVRSFVVGEGMKIELGAALGGVIENKKDINVNFTIDNSLVTPDILTLMQSGESYIVNSVTGVQELSPVPPNYYTLSNAGKIVIKSGQHSGSVVMKADSSAFLSDPATIRASYAIPLYITSSDADSILESRRYAVIGLKYENMLFGNYLHGGITVQKDPAGTVIDTVRYFTTVNQVESKIWTLTTIAPNALAVKGYSSVSSSKNELVLTLDGGNITVSRASGSTFNFQPEGASIFNRSKLLQDRKIYLNYKYVNASGNTCYAQDTLTFRNRIRDGVNEWQDENPSHY